MKLTITTPLDVLVNDEDILSLRAEDATGGFGIFPRHADFMTALGVSVVRWRTMRAEVRYCAVNNGLLIVTEGEYIAIASREAVVGADLADLKQRVLGEFSAAGALESETRLAQERFQAETLHRIQSYLHQEDYIAPPT